MSCFRGESSVGARFSERRCSTLWVRNSTPLFDAESACEMHTKKRSFSDAHNYSATENFILQGRPGWAGHARRRIGHGAGWRANLDTPQYLRSSTPIPVHSTEQLATALAGRYHIERTLGAGGMATVY